MEPKENKHAFAKNITSLLLAALLIFVFVFIFLFFGESLKIVDSNDPQEVEELLVEESIVQEEEEFFVEELANNFFRVVSTKKNYIVLFDTDENGDKVVDHYREE